MLKQMGWKEGEGLGKYSSGIQAPIEAIKREQRTGLGTNAPPSIPRNAGDTYQDVARRSFQARFAAMEQQSHSSTTSNNGAAEEYLKQMEKYRSLDNTDGQKRPMMK
jgi:hypothetical protein